MTSLAMLLLAAVLLTDFRLLGGSRLVALIRAAALQGALLAVMALAFRLQDLQQGAAFAALGTALVKGVVLPGLLLHALRRVAIQREVEPIVGYGGSLVLGGVVLAAALAWTPPGTTVAGGLRHLALALGILTIFTGLFLVVARRKALTQVLGYLVFENGIYVLGIVVAREQPLLVELGVLLDLFVAVFVMGIVVFHIQRTFDHIDVDQLAALGRTPSAPGGEAP